MIVMPSNQKNAAFRELEASYPRSFAHLFSIRGWVPPVWDYALDNGAYTSFLQQKPYDREAFFSLCEQARRHVEAGGRPPVWVAVPDVVKDRSATLRAWDEYYTILSSRYGWPLAFVVQDDMTEKDVPSEATVVFVGGSTKWKHRMIHYWTDRFPRVHVGKVNTGKWLWYCHRHKVESVDGTGWWHDSPIQLQALRRYMTLRAAGHDRCPNELAAASRTLFPQDRAI